MPEPGPIVPPGRRDHFLGGYHQPGVRSQRRQNVHPAHQAGIKAHDVEARPGGLQRRSQLGQGQVILAGAALIPIKARTAAAVIPQDESNVLCRIVGRTPRQKVGQGRRVAHVDLTQVGQEQRLATAGDLVAARAGPVAIEGGVARAELRADAVHLHQHVYAGRQSQWILQFRGLVQPMPRVIRA
jgi:hypothetical protein